MINWKYIKGLNENNGADPLYTFLYFERDYALREDKTDFSFVPFLDVQTTNNTINDINNARFGHIITQKATNQHIDTLFTFKNSVKFTDENYNSCTFNWDSNNNFNTTVSQWYIKAGSNTMMHFDAASSLIKFGPLFDVHIQKSLKIGNATSQSTLYSGDLLAERIYSDNSCNALYFNATSDRRAKDNLKILNFKALDLINHTNLYSFTYKDTNTPSIGIIAQDVQNINIEGFKLVDNENATGKDMDYMSIHESKLIYILWQAIKEQQKEIEELKKRLN